MRKPSVVAVLVCLLGLIPAVGFGQARRGLTAETEKQLRASLAKGEAYLLQEQKPDGIWENHPGIAALAATAILKQPGSNHEKQLALTAKTLDGLAKLAKPDG